MQLLTICGYQRIHDYNGVSMSMFIRQVVSTCVHMIATSCSSCNAKLVCNLILQYICNFFLVLKFYMGYVAHAFFGKHIWCSFSMLLMHLKVVITFVNVIILIRLMNIILFFQNLHSHSLHVFKYLIFFVQELGGWFSQREIVPYNSRACKNSAHL